MKKNNIFTLLLMIFSLLNAVGLNELSIVGKAKKTSDIVPSSIKDANNRRAACIIFLTDLNTDMDFKPNIELVKLISNIGKHEVYVQPGERVIEILASDFKPFNLVLSTYGISKLESGDVYQIEITGNKKNVQPPTIQQIDVKSIPSNATVYMNGANVGVTPLKMAIQSGNYDFKIEKKGYISKSFDKYPINKKSFSLRANLVENIAYLDLKIEPKNSELYIDNKKMPFADNQIIKLLPVNHKIKVVAEGYLSKEINISLSLQETKKISFDLHKNIAFYGPYIYPHDSELYVDGTLVPLEDLELKPGSYNIKITKKGYTPISEAISIGLDESMQKDYILKPKFVKFSLTSNIKNSVFRIVENNVLISEWVGNRIFTQFPVGNYKISCDAKDYSRKVDDIDLKSDFNYDFILKEGSDVPDNMVFVKGGTFQMGSHNGESDEKPIHSVTLSDFYIGKYEVTQKEWKEIMSTSTSLSNPSNDSNNNPSNDSNNNPSNDSNNNPSKFKGDNRPVEQVSWFDAIEFCNKKSIKEGLEPCYIIDKKTNDPDNKESTDKSKWIVKTNFNNSGYRLPTEAEWEYAARGGNKSNGYEYSGSNDISRVAWYSDRYGRTHDVGCKQPNELGIYDMSGNVWEWCWDRYNSSYYGSSPSSNPHGANSGSDRVSRGGGWYNTANYLRVAYRGYDAPSGTGDSIGFRICRNNS